MNQLDGSLNGIGKHQNEYHAKLLGELQANRFLVYWLGIGSANPWCPSCPATRIKVIK